MSLFPFFVILGLLPSTIWLLFYLRRDKRPEPNGMVIKIFLFGMLSTIPAVLIEWPFKDLLEKTSWSPLVVSIVYFLIAVALTEELLKFLVFKLSVEPNQEFDEPVDAMIYMIIIGLGFAAVENILILFSLTQPYLIEKTTFALLGRFAGATFLHALCSANIGFFFALSLFKTRKRKLLLLIGLSLSILLHTAYNLIITMEGNAKFGLIAILLTSLFLIVLFQFYKIKQLPSVCRVKTKK